MGCCMNVIQLKHGKDFGGETKFTFTAFLPLVCLGYFFSSFHLMYYFIGTSVATPKVLYLPMTEQHGDKHESC